MKKKVQSRATFWPGLWGNLKFVVVWKSFAALVLFAAGFLLGWLLT